MGVDTIWPVPKPRDFLQLDIHSRDLLPCRLRGQYPSVVMVRSCVSYRRLVSVLSSAAHRVFYLYYKPFTAYKPLEEKWLFDCGFLSQNASFH